MTNATDAQTSSTNPQDASGIRLARATDVAAILGIYEAARAFMRRTGNATQWANGYPTIEDVKADLAQGSLYVLEEEGEVQAVFFFSSGPDPTYAQIDGAWIANNPYYVVHRIAAREGSGAGRRCIAWACEQGRDVRIDTHEHNAPMRHVLSTLGFAECGIIICNDGTPRVAYQHLAERG